MVADIVGYSRLIDKDEAGALTAIRELRVGVIEPIIREHDGRLIKLMGDGLLTEFHSAVDAVVCAIAMQKAIAANQASVPGDERIAYRIGINLGDVVVEGDDILGDGVNVAARLEQLCPVGGVLISGTVYDHMRGKLALPIDFVGKQPVKNISQPVRAYSVRLEGAKPGLGLKFRARRSRSLLNAAAAALIALPVIGAGLWWTIPTEPALAKSAVAVLPFDNLGREDATSRLADGIMEDIITDLARFPDFTVIARNSTATYAGKPVDVRKVGQDLKVRYVLEGSVQRDGDEVRVTAQLIDAASGEHVWSQRWTRPAGEVFKVQSEIVREAVNQLGGSGVIMAAESRAAQRKRPQSLSAYEKYLLGRDRILTPTKERLDEAIVLFREALAKDPTLARAWVDLAWAYDQSIGYGADFAEVHPLSLMAARRAVEVDPMDAGAHAVLGNMVATDGDFVQGKAEYETALRLNPGSADILALYSGWASTFGDPQKGAELADEAVRLNPNYPPAQSGALSYAYFMADRYQDALRIIERQPAENRTRYGWVLRAATYAALDQADNAKAATSDALKRYPDLTAEGFANDPGFNDRERRKLAETIRDAGFPPCAKPEQLARIEKPMHLPECVEAADDAR
ncbi:adenylate/guanylate cyclase domain-containing protein [Mesorhizobium sp. B2-8-9]|uniref:adenylate/guanylate cyclase domain-containing protein n=1 Tax=Mesorhizobium sp. B2-8-9 TaxID=2589899 RepID=UPI00112BAE19|nr:adenylate/guanylate cyclase domain-containing protein [Mesorhizobium sp. B2-8-9]TPI72534.1 adenylate/guanylate cyclase domain-containing protein [Mesorhizobium sp. B2-8-9]